MIVEQYWAGIARRLEIESGVLNGLIPHNLEMGIQNELTLARMLERLVPPSIGVGTGLVFDHSGAFSKQMDIVLFDRSSQPQLLAQTTQVLFPVETVKGVIEVKTNLSSNDIVEDFPAKKKSIRALKPLEDFKVPVVGLFAYAFADSNFGRAEELAHLSEEDAPDLACVIDPGFAINTNGVAGFVPLIDPEAVEGMGDSEARWARPTDKETHVLIDGVQHPTYQLGKYRGDRFIGDPGRALLIFCLSLLELLGSTGEFEWISKYSSARIGAIQTLGDGEAMA